VSAIDDTIDGLYQLPLAEFTAARNALAKTLKGDEAASVKRLEKPTVVPWAINQLYWRERRTFDRLIASGRALRTAQIAALKGKTSDVRAATSAHRDALAAAVATTAQIAAQSGSHPPADAISRMLEALSLAPEPPEHPGRFTDVVQPAGFEALAGVTPVVRIEPRPAPEERESPARAPSGKSRGDTTSATRGSSAAAIAAQRRRAEEAAAARKAAEAEVRARERQLDRALAAQARAQAHADAVRQQLESAEAALKGTREEVEAAEKELTRSKAALER
jgi:hypothetical protein